MLKKIKIIIKNMIIIFYSINKLLKQLKFENEKKKSFFLIIGEIEEKYLLIVLMKLLLIN